MQSQAPADLNVAYLAKELPAMRTTKTSSACLIKHSGKAGTAGRAPWQNMEHCVLCVCLVQKDTLFPCHQQPLLNTLAARIAELQMCLCRTETSDEQRFPGTVHLQLVEGIAGSQ